MGRPERLTAERWGRFIQATRAGAPIDLAARWAGFSRSTFFRYMEAATPRHAAFRDEVLTARTELELQLAGVLAKEAKKSPRWALELLRLRFPARWGRHAPDDELETPATPPGPPEELVMLDASLIDELVSKLLEAGRRRSNTSSKVDLSAFEERRPRQDEEPES